MAGNNEDRPIKVIPFSGKKADWCVWEEKFLARARRKGYKSILKGNVQAPKDSERFDERTAEGKRKAKL